MIRISAAAALAALVLGLAGCESPEVAYSSQAGIRFDNVGYVRDKAADKMAAEHCAEFGKTARLTPDNVPDGTVTYVCE